MATLTPPKIHEVVLRFDGVDDKTTDRLHQALAAEYPELSLGHELYNEATVIMIQIEDDWPQLNWHMSNIARLYEKVTGLECDWRYM